MDSSVIQRIPLFRTLSEEALANVTPLFGAVSMRRGQYLYRENDASDYVFFLLTGKLKISKQLEDGRTNLLRVVGPGESLGYETVIVDAPRQDSAVALCNSEALFLTNQDFLRLITENSGANMVIMKDLIRLWARSQEHRSGMVFCDVTGQVAQVLLDFANRFGEPVKDRPGAIRVRHGLTQEEIAQLVGASRETVNKALGYCAEREWVQLESRSVIILDLERMRARALP